jgi:hypothetical protein
MKVNDRAALHLAVTPWDSSTRIPWFVLLVSIVAMVSMASGCRIQSGYRSYHEATHISQTESGPTRTIEVPPQAEIGPVEVAQDDCLVGIRIPDSFAGAGTYWCSCGGLDHGSNAVWVAINEASTAKAIAKAQGERFRAIIKTRNKTIWYIKWWIED